MKGGSEKSEGRIVGPSPTSAGASLCSSSVPSRTCVEVSAGLVFRAGKLLITQRHADSHLGGLWEFPGGKREAGESFEQCLVRELREELGVKVRVGRLFEEITHAYPEQTVRLQFFLCRLAAGEPRPLGCAAVNWIGRKELDAYVFPAADATLLGKLKGVSDLWHAG